MRPRGHPFTDTEDLRTRGAEQASCSADRLNVAISRARCLAYLVCTEEVLDSRGRDDDEMRLISTLCAFTETAQGATRPAR